MKLIFVTRRREEPQVKTRTRNELKQQKMLRLITLYVLLIVTVHSIVPFHSSLSTEKTKGSSVKNSLAAIKIMKINKSVRSFKEANPNRIDFIRSQKSLHF